MSLKSEVKAWDIKYYIIHMFQVSTNCDFKIEKQVRAIRLQTALSHLS
jgi:hypothetical protein